MYSESYVGSYREFFGDASLPRNGDAIMGGSNWGSGGGAIGDVFRLPGIGVFFARSCLLCYIQIGCSSIPYYYAS